MSGDARAFRRSGVCRPFLAAIAFLAAFFAASRVAAAQDIAIQLDPQRTTITFTLTDVLHTVRGTFRLKQGLLRLDAPLGKLSGEILVDAASGESGNGMRDRTMHRDVLESNRYPEIAFHPDRFEGVVSLQGKSSIRVHGIITVHGSNHELTVPTEVEISADHCDATLHFAVPYAKWGMKNPSTFFLRVSESVDIDVTTVGTFGRR
jgi:polyisoprenoid-binding protein YceI